MYYSIEFIDGLYCVFDSQKNLIKKFNHKRHAEIFCDYMEHFELMKLIINDY